jgi:hypothetical protein
MESLPGKIKDMAQLMRISRDLNRVMGCSYYNPHVLLEMSADEIEDLTLAATLLIG